MSLRLSASVLTMSRLAASNLSVRIVLVSEALKGSLQAFYDVGAHYIAAQRNCSGFILAFLWCGGLGLWVLVKGLGSTWFPIETLQKVVTPYVRNPAERLIDS